MVPPLTSTSAARLLTARGASQPRGAGWRWAIPTLPQPSRQRGVVVGSRPRSRFEFARPRRVRARLRDERALELRAAGYTYAQVGEDGGYSPQAAHQAVKRALRTLGERIAERAGELRALEAAKLDRL